MSFLLLGLGTSDGLFIQNKRLPLGGAIPSQYYPNPSLTAPLCWFLPMNPKGVRYGVTLSYRHCLLVTAVKLV